MSYNRRPAILVEQHLAIFLWCLVSSVEYRTVAHLFGLSRVSVCLILCNVYKAILKLLMHQYVQLPKNEDQVSGCDTEIFAGGGTSPNLV